MRVCLKILLSLWSRFLSIFCTLHERTKSVHAGVSQRFSFKKRARSFFSSSPETGFKEASPDESTATNSRAAAKGVFVASRKRPRADTRVAREKETLLRRRRRRYEQRKRKRKRKRGSRFVFVGGGRHARQRGSQRAKRAEEERKESWRRRRRRCVEVVVFRGFVVARNARLRADVDQRQDTDFTDTGSGDAAIQGKEERGSDEHFRGFDDDGVDRRCHYRRG